MELDPDVCYRALRTRDARFDGRFFTAVRSTGVYCRPVCPARTPRRENCLFLPCAAAAQEAGYRPCLRCRPEAAPGTPAWLGTSATVSRALRLIEEGALDRGSAATLADRLGVGERHLRRLFVDHLGATPGAVARTRRILFAKKLIDETALPMTRVAYGAGFSSVRRFNDALRETYGRPPRSLRRAGTSAREPESVSLRLPYRPPYPWRAVLGYLAARATRGVEWVDGDRYERTFEQGGVSGRISVRAEPDAPALRVCIRLAAPAPLIHLAERVRAVFDLGASPDEIGDVLGRTRALRGRLRALPGVRVPGAWDGFELAVRAILGQQVSVAAATTLAGRVAEAHGAPLPAALASEGAGQLFPRPEVLARADLTAQGVTRRRADAIRTLARTVAAGEITLAPSSDPDATIAALEALPGLGPWTAQYIAMRALREPDAFPHTDLGLLRALGTTPAALLAAAEAWRPWRAYAAMLLWQSPPPLRSTARAARRRPAGPRTRSARPA